MSTFAAENLAGQKALAAVLRDEGAPPPARKRHWKAGLKVGAGCWQVFTMQSADGQSYNKRVDGDITRIGRKGGKSSLQVLVQLDDHEGPTRLIWKKKEQNVLWGFAPH